VAAVLAIGYSAEAELLLCFDDGVDGFVFEGREFRGGELVFVARVEEVLGPF
jgi:hypothetical protein